MNQIIGHTVLTIAMMLAALPAQAITTLTSPAQGARSSVLHIVTATEDEISEIVDELSHADGARVLVATDGATDPFHQRMARGLKTNIKSNRHGIIIALVPSVTSSMTLVLSGQFLAATGVAGLAWAFEILPTLAQQPFETTMEKLSRVTRAGLFGKLGGLVAYNSAKNVIIGSLTGNFIQIFNATAGQALQGLLDQFLSTQESLDLAAEQLEQRGVVNSSIAKAIPHGRNLLAGISDTLSLFGFDALGAVIKNIPQAGVVGLLLGSKQTAKISQLCTRLLTSQNSHGQETL